MPATSTQNAPAKSTGATCKGTVNKVPCKEMPTSPGGVAAGAGVAGVVTMAGGDRDELLGSLTTLQQQRTSARVIKKLRLDDAAHDKKESVECEPAPKLLKEEEVKDLAKLTAVKPRMPKALWMPEEKSLFFEALNEYGKDFDAITNYICAKLKRKGVPDAMLKTKSQVSHFYYRTWHKLSKHVHFDENVKKVAQELYALINYGELRKKLTSVNEKTCARLGEMVCCGGLTVRARGRSVRVRTPTCRALRRLNQIAERAAGARVCGRCLVVMRARTAAAWSRVLAAAHNPRAAAELPLRTKLRTFIQALEARWDGVRTSKHIKVERNEGEEGGGAGDAGEPEGGDNHLNLQTERCILDEHKLARRVSLHVGPSPKTVIHLPTLTASEQLSSQKICFASYLERMCRDPPPKIRTPKRTRKDSSTEKDKEVEPKKLKVECKQLVNIEETAIDGIELIANKSKPVNIDETAIDGIELIANIRTQDEDKPSTEDEREMRSEELTEEERDGNIDNVPGGVGGSAGGGAAAGGGEVMSEREKDSSELEDSDKYNVDSDGEDVDQHKGTATAAAPTPLNNLKVKFRIRSKKRGGSVYTLVTETPARDPTGEPTGELAGEPPRETAGESAREPTGEPSREPAEDHGKLSDEHKVDEADKPDVDVEMATRQIRKGWSMYDAGQLTIGDLYLMFGSRSKIELDYWWAEPCPPLPAPRAPPPASHAARTPEKGTDSPLEDDKDRRESDTDIFSPKNVYSQDSNDGLSGDERKNEQLLSPEHKFPSLPLASKLVNRPDPPPAASPHHPHLAMISDRLKRLLALAGNPHIVPQGGAGAAAGNKCACGHLCTKKKNNERPHQPAASGGSAPPPAPGATPPVPPPAPQVFRHPVPIAPRLDTAEVTGSRPVSTVELPRWRRGRPRAADRRVVVQRLLPLLPKLAPAHNLIPVKLVSNAPPQPQRIAPRPPPPPAPTPPPSNETSNVYVLSELNGQFFFHDGERRIPLTGAGAPSPPHPAAPAAVPPEHYNGDTKLECQDSDDMEEYVIGMEEEGGDAGGAAPPLAAELARRTDSSDITGGLTCGGCDVSMWSPGRLLRDTEGAWLDASVHDFSLSSFLGHLDSRPQPDPQVESQLHSLLAESSVDYVAKFADLAAEVSGDTAPPPSPPAPPPPPHPAAGDDPTTAATSNSNNV